MSSAIEILEKRRSCKKYLSDKRVPEETLRKIAEVGTYAANGKGLQAGMILIVDNKEIRDQLSKMNAEVMGAQGDPFYGAPQVIVALADTSVPTYVYDGSLVMGNMMAAAEELGVSSCWIHRAKQVFSQDAGKAILKKAGIEGDYEGIGFLIVGYKDGEPAERKPRKEGFVHIIK